MRKKKVNDTRNGDPVMFNATSARTRVSSQRIVPPNAPIAHNRLNSGFLKIGVGGLGARGRTGPESGAVEAEPVPVETMTAPPLRTLDDSSRAHFRGVIAFPYAAAFETGRVLRGQQHRVVATVGMIGLVAGETAGEQCGVDHDVAQVHVSE